MSEWHYSEIKRLAARWWGAGVMRSRLGCAGALTWAALLFGGMVCSHAPAIAGSDNGSDTYAGDYTGGSLPPGTFVFLQYLGYFHAEAFIDPTGAELPSSHANVLEEFTRFAYIGRLWGHALAVEAEIPVATLTDVNIPGTNNLVAGGLVDPVVHLTYFFIADADVKVQRWFGITNYFYLPLGRRFDNQKAVNVSTARQFTDVPQIGYTEGLEKFSPALHGVFFDLVANASLHTNGNSPIALVNPASAPVPGVLTYDTLTQRPSYDVRAFLRFEPKTFLFAAVGIEKSWGGEQTAANGRFAVTGLPLVMPLTNLSLSKDDFLRGHFQFQVPIAKDFAIGGDVFHDFDRLGGLKNVIGAEIRLTKFFFPQSPSK
jgi:hypothetical protein